MKTAARAAVASSVHGRVQRRQQQKWAAQETASFAAQPQPMQVHHVVAAQPAPPAAPAPAAGDMQEKIELLRQLGELRDSGIIDEAEFAVKKAQILA